MAGPVLKAQFDLDGSKFQRNMDRIKRGAKSSVKEIENLGRGGGGMGEGILGKALGTGAALLGIAKFNAEVDKMVTKLEAVKNLSLQTGFDSETIQKFNNLGIGEDAGKGLEKLAEVQAKILGGEDGDFKLAKAFAELGVSLDDIKSKNFHQLFFQIAEAMKTAEVSAAKLNALSETMGGKAPDMIAAFKRGLDSPEANHGILSNKDVDKVNQLSQWQKKEGAFAKDVATGTMQELKMWWQRLRLGLTVAPKLPSMIMRSPDDMWDEIKQERITRNGTAKLQARDARRAQEKLAAVQREAGDKVAAEEQIKAEKKMADDRRKKAVAALKNRAGLLGLFQSDTANNIERQNLFSRNVNHMQAIGAGSRGVSADFQMTAEQRRMTKFQEMAVNELKEIKMKLGIGGPFAE